MARKERPVGEYVQINWTKLIGMAIGLVLGITSVALFMMWAK